MIAVHYRRVPHQVLHQFFAIFDPEMVEVLEPFDRLFGSGPANLAHRLVSGRFWANY